MPGGGYDLTLLDVMLPGVGGFEVLSRVRARSSMPVIMLTARGEDVDRIVGLEMGADDYLSKPFNPRELAARIRSVLRRARPADKAPQDGPAPSGGKRLTVGDVSIETGTRTVTRGGETVELTSIEFNLLEVLLRAAGRVVSREELSSAALDRDLTRYDRSVDVHVSSLRRKLGRKAGELERIKTVRGSGYLYCLPSGSSSS